MIYEDFESTLVPEDNGKQICNESYTIKKMLLVIMAQLICVNDKFSKSYLGEDTVYNFINSMTK